MEQPISTDNCNMCLDPFDNDNSVSYRFNDTIEWTPFGYCKYCLKELLDTQWDMYISSLRKADCKQSLVSQIKKGPPKNFRDNIITRKREVHEFFYDNSIHSAKLKGSLNDNDTILLDCMLYGILHLLENDVVSSTDTNQIKSVDDFDHEVQIEKILKKFNL